MFIIHENLQKGAEITQNNRGGFAGGPLYD